VYFLPLLPLALLMLSGMYMLCLPYAAPWRGGRRVGRGSETGRHEAERVG
jgi:hypothetical protein